MVSQAPPESTAKRAPSVTRNRGRSRFRSSSRRWHRRRSGRPRRHRAPRGHRHARAWPHSRRPTAVRSVGALGHAYIRQLESATAPEVARAHRQLKAAPDSAGKGPSICRSTAARGVRLRARHRRPGRHARGAAPRGGDPLAIGHAGQAYANRARVVNDDKPAPGRTASKGPGALRLARLVGEPRSWRVRPPVRPESRRARE
jgi:hypothetical protein